MVFPMNIFQKEAQFGFFHSKLEKPQSCTVQKFTNVKVLCHKIEDKKVAMP